MSQRGKKDVDGKARRAMTSACRSADATIPTRGWFGLTSLEPLQPMAATLCFFIIILVLAVGDPEALDIGKGDVAIHGLALRSSGTCIEGWCRRRCEGIDDMVRMNLDVGWQLCIGRAG